MVKTTLANGFTFLAFDCCVLIHVDAELSPAWAGFFSALILPPPAASLAMALGSGIGLWAYFNIAWYSAALISTVISMVIVIAGGLLAPGTCDWRALAKAQHSPKPEATT